MTPGMRVRALEFLRPVEGGFQLAKRDPSFLAQAAGRGAVPSLRGGYEELERARCPVLVVRAKRSSTLAQEDLVYLRSMGNVQLREADSGHDVVGEAAVELVREMSEWLHITG